MTPPPRTIKSQVGRYTLDIPICENEETTIRIVQQVNECLQKIEDESDRVDSMAYALKAAVSFAAELHKAEAERANETKEILLALDAISEALRAILQNAQPPE